MEVASLVYVDDTILLVLNPAAAATLIRERRNAANTSPQPSTLTQPIPVTAAQTPSNVVTQPSVTIYLYITIHYIYRSTTPAYVLL